MRSQQLQQNIFKKRASHEQSLSKNDLFQHYSHQRKFTQTFPFPFNQGVNYVDNKQTQHEREIQNSININIKSNTKELIETKQYESKPPNNDGQQLVVDHKINNQRSLELSWMQNFVDSSNNDQVKNSFNDEFIQCNEQLSSHTITTYGCSFSDISKLSQLFCQVMLKSDSKRIKQLNSTNQQLKSVCKQIVAIIRVLENQRSEQYDNQIVKQIHRIILNYQNKTKSIV